MGESIDIQGFYGMNDVNMSDRGPSRSGFIAPIAVLNADVDGQGALRKRIGKTLTVTLSGSHSLWAGISCMLCSASGHLYRLNGSAVIDLGSITGPESPLSYEEVDGLVYISNKYWNKKLDPKTNTLSQWGLTIPNGPALLSSSTGSLPIGTYNVCLTNVSGSDISGNSPISSITLTSVGGVQILNRSIGSVVWCTDQNEGIFYRIGEVDLITDVMTVEPLPTFMCSSPPLLSNLCHAFGLMWGSLGNDVYYSQPFRPSLFRLSLNKFPFNSEITLIARVPTGLFIGTIEETFFLEGTEPEKMQQKSVGVGAVRNSLTYCNNVPALGDVLQTSEKGYQDVPMWRSHDGIVIGNAAGKLYNLTKNKVKLDVPMTGASVYRFVDGTFQFLTSSPIGRSGSSIGGLNAETLALFESGKVSQSEFTHKGQGSTALCTDMVTCEVRRGGVLI